MVISAHVDWRTSQRRSGTRLVVALPGRSLVGSGRDEDEMPSTRREYSGGVEPARSPRRIESMVEVKRRRGSPSGRSTRYVGGYGS